MARKIAHQSQTELALDDTRTPPAPSVPKKVGTVVREIADQGQIELALDEARTSWPPTGRFPYNFGHERVERVVRADLLGSKDVLLITGYTSLDWIINLLAAFRGKRDAGGRGADRIRILIGVEPQVFSSRHAPALSRHVGREMTDYWLERGLSLFQSARVLLALEELDRRQVEIRISGTSRVHAKLYRGDRAITIGSSNYSRSGMELQVEGNVRIEQIESPRFEEACALGEAIWELGEDHKAELRALIERLLKVVGWKEALARAASEVLEGEWSQRFIEPEAASQGHALWPTQIQGIGQAMWVLENSGSVLIADATGSGKTRMGVQLIRAIEKRSVSTGRARHDLPVLVCPPTIRDVWRREAVGCGQPLNVYSHGELSQPSSHTHDEVREAVGRAQIMAIDEAHNYLNFSSRRSRLILENIADHVLLFTATPINRGVEDLLTMIDVLGADNFEDDVLDVMDTVLKRRRWTGEGISESEQTVIHAAVSEFVVRRTKSAFNRLIDREPERYHNVLGERCRYPRHTPETYPTGETRTDKALALEVREKAAELKGLINLRKPIELTGFRKRAGVSEEALVRMRLNGARALASYRVNASVRSSRAALKEHLLGTRVAWDAFDLGAPPSSKATGNVVATLQRIAGHPPKAKVRAKLPDWLTDPRAHERECHAEVEIYEQIDALADRMSSKRTDARVERLLDLVKTHERVLAFDWHIISLHVIERTLRQWGWDAIVIATGDDRSKRKLHRYFGLGTTEGPAIGLCSDAISEAMNLQAASAVVHLNLPSVIRVLEQRVGRIDRMDSPHAEITVHYPRNSPEFSLRADDRLIERHRLVDDILGSNVPLPAEYAPEDEPEADAVLATKDLIRDVENAALVEAAGDDFRDAFFPVRRLIGGEDGLVSEEVYERIRTTKAHVLASVSVVRAERPWAFLAIGGLGGGAPRWVLFDDLEAEPIHGLESVCAGLRERLRGEPADVRFEDESDQVLATALTRLMEDEERLLPRKKQRALGEMRAVLTKYQATAKRQKQRDRVAVVEELLGLLDVGVVGPSVDLARLADGWLDLVRPTWQAYLMRPGRRGVARMKAIRKTLTSEPLETEALQSLHEQAVRVPPLDQRVVAAIVGVVG